MDDKVIIKHVQKLAENSAILDILDGSDAEAALQIVEENILSQEQLFLEGAVELYNSTLQEDESKIVFDRDKGEFALDYVAKDGTVYETIAAISLSEIDKIDMRSTYTVHSLSDVEVWKKFLEFIQEELASLASKDLEEIKLQIDLS